MVAGTEGAAHPGAPRDENPGSNRVLAMLAEADAALILPHLKPVPLHPGQILGQTGTSLSWVLFPGTGVVVSLVAMDRAGHTMEAVSVGREGLIGPELAHLPEFGHLQVQMPGIGYRMDSAMLDRLAGGSAGLREALALHQRALLVHVLQSAVCSALHPVEARVSRWLLMAQDRTGHPDLPVTQELLAEMLGVRRTTVTRVMAQLSDRGLIQHRRSWVTVLDREGLEHAACGCHAALLQRLRHVAPALYPPN
jgi:CRP-like cAMP-binding protein